MDRVETNKAGNTKSQSSFYLVKGTYLNKQRFSHFSMRICPDITYCSVIINVKKKKIRYPVLHHATEDTVQLFSKSGISSNTVVPRIRKDSILNHYFHILWGSLSKQLFSYLKKSNYFLSLLRMPFTAHINFRSG